VFLAGSIISHENLATANTVSLPQPKFLFEFGSLCAIATNFGCVDPDGPGPLELGDGQFRGIADVIVNSQGKIIVADQSNQRVQVFDSAGNFLLKFGSRCSLPDDPIGTCIDPDGPGPLELGDGQFGVTAGVTVDSSDKIYVVDSGGNNRVQVFDANGNFLRKFGSVGPNDGQFFNAWDVAVKSDGNIIVTDNTKRNVHVFDSLGNFLSKFGSFCNISTGDGCIDPDGPGPLELGDGQFAGPGKVTVDSSDNIYVIDLQNHRVQVFDSAGNFLFKFGTFGIYNGEFDRPNGIAVDNLKQIYVSDTNNNRIQVFDSTGNFLTVLGSQGTGDGQFDHPSGLAVGSLAIADDFNSRIQVFESFCTPPTENDWIVTESCTMVATSTAPANVIVQDGATLTIPNGLSLTIPNSNNLQVKFGGTVLIEAGGTILLG